MSERLTNAITYAAKAHEGQRRKVANTPYILHPMEVASIIGTMTADEDIIIAGLLHDTIEDCGKDPREIKALFGARVAALVQSESEDRLSDRPPAETWYDRKAESLLMLEHTKDIDVKILWLGDKLSNIRSFYREYCRIGDELWLSLNQKDKKMQGWYYKTIAANIPELADTAAFREYTDYVNKIFGEDA